ncbi:mandelate racemase/muconate lactonizing enzyme family protein [Microbacterium sp. SL75]|uniref:mandelate racemase/muconate lactonizing enzyme family protein n=1 Tax=Microbacterium sp. SL75 TaxID=2995140 RepID=UPI00226FA06B|nr:mandelate racemase/muconate lactonizing enzyme family protein [Microbacterium sp. SL75]WAC70294.1 mandelate racemase/muconate lactonizing enzyme family protein [Microbacterium sp. SL75]
MKITGYRLINTTLDWGRPVGDVNGFITSGLTALPLVVVETDEGIEGIGCGMHDGIPQLFEAVEGEDPRATASLYDRMIARMFKNGHGGAVFGGIGALDSAFWDIKAKEAGQPLWRLLGGRSRHVPGYASGLDIALDSDGLTEYYSEMSDRGFTAAKLKGGRDVSHDAERLALVRDLLGRATDEPLVMLDANESWNLPQAVRYIQRLQESVELAWIEEPLRRWDAQGLRRLRDSIAPAVATGENLTGLEQYRNLFDAQAVDIVQSSAVWGITHALRVAVAAHARDLPVSPIGMTSNPAVANAATALPNHLLTEVTSLRVPTGVRLDYEIADGGLVLGDEPGGGVSLDASVLDGSAPYVWGGESGPHVRDSRAGLELGVRLPPRGAGPE